MFAISLFLSLITIFVFNDLGLRYDWFHIYWWYDIPMHIAGGAWVAAAFIYFARQYEWIARIAPPTFIHTLGVVLLVGIGWEIFEYSVDVFIFQKYTFSTVPAFILIDSLHDLLNDLIGAALAFFVWRRYAVV